MFVKRMDFNCYNYHSKNACTYSVYNNDAFFVKYDDRKISAGSGMLRMKNAPVLSNRGSFVN